MTGPDADDVLHLAELEQVAELVAGLIERERAEPGSVPELAVRGLHSATLFWTRQAGART